MIAELAAAFGRRLHEAGLPVTPERSARFADALSLTEPVARTRLYWVARAVFVSDHAQVRAFDRVFFEIFGGETFTYDAPPDEVHELAVADDRPAGANAAGGAPGGASPAPGDGTSDSDAVSVVPVMASAEERLRDKHFDALEPAELAALYRLMSELEVAAPIRRTRRAKRDRRGPHIDLRRTLRGSLRTGGDPIHLARRDRREVRRKIVLLCDISGSMEPYARAYLQFLTCAGKDAEAFVFATRLTRITRALATRSPERAIQRAAAAAPDWSSGTRIGDALREFNDRIRMISIQPDSPLHGLEGLKHMETAIIPGIYDATLADDDLGIATEEAFELTRQLASQGLFVGISSGAALAGALRVARDTSDAVIVAIFPDGGEKYLSERFWDQAAEGERRTR